MTGIFYFSSTGNSLYIAQKIKERLQGRIVYIPNYKEDEAKKFDLIIIVSPIYSFGLPVQTYELFSKLPQDVKTYVVLNYGGMAGGAGLLTLELAQKYKVNIRAVYKIKMVENYTLFISTPKLYNKINLNSADKKINNIINAIADDKICLPKNRKNSHRLYYSNKPNWHLIAENFSVNEKCTACGKCVKICPVGNIVLNNGKIQFNDKCTACLGCYHRCPQKAIIYKGRNKKYRYINPYIDENDIGKNFDK